MDRVLATALAAAECRVALARIRLGLVADQDHIEGEDMPYEHFQGLAATLRKDVGAAVEKARALKERGSETLGAFHRASDAMHAVYDEIDAATSEIHGVLLPEGSNGAPIEAGETSVKNSSEALPEPPAPPAPGEPRAMGFSDLHPSLRQPAT